MLRKIQAALALASLCFFAIYAFGAAHPSSQQGAQPGNSNPTPVIVELFTSEGCSSCPPVDAFLKKLDDTRHVEGVEIIGIEEHVDYWDRLGWTDPFSSHDWTERQRLYSRALRQEGIYTPQLIVNGTVELRAISNRDAVQRIVEAAKKSAAELQLSVITLSPKSAQLSFTAKNLPEAGSAELWLAVTERGLSSNVLRGENEGRNLVHAAILRSLTRVSAAGKFSVSTAAATATVSLKPSWQPENLRFVIFLQDRKSLRILGAAAASGARQSNAD
jgi:hypothetical protein